MEDVYDERIWKEFMERNFFSSEFNVGLMLNTDWFKPYKRSEYKVAALMLTVLNLPREDRFKKKWTIFAGIIPGPHEPTGNINTFLEPLVDDLMNLWTGVPLVSEGSQNIRAALLAVTADMPALRKLTQFLGHKADLGCSKCKFRAQREPGTQGATGRMSYLTTSTSIARTHVEVAQQAEEFRNAPTKTAAGAIARRNGVRYSELIRLPYFDIVSMSVTDPMHTFLLGMVRRETEYNLRFLNQDQRKEFVRRVKSVKVPYDVGRLPSNIFDAGEEPAGVTAAQWKLYIITYARPCLFKLLPERAYKCLVLLSEIVSLVVYPVFTSDKIERLKRLLLQHHLLFSQVYGKWAVTVNYHMSLHLPEMILDLGPPHSYWCFAYERLNGILAGIPNCHRSVETEVANRFALEMSFSTADQLKVDTVKIPRSIQQFLITADEEDYTVPFPLSYLVLSRLENTLDDKFEAQMALDRGDVEGWPVELKHPCKRNVRVNTTFMAELKNFFDGLYGLHLDYIRPRIDKYGRCSVNGINFLSDFNSTDRGSIIKSMFVDTTNELSPYFGVVRFYFKVTTVIRTQVRIHQLAYVTWLRFRPYHHQHVCKFYGVTNHVYQGDRILSPRRFLCRCVLVSPGTNASFSLVSELAK